MTRDAPIVLMHVSAGNPFRRWPAEHFARVAAALARAIPRGALSSPLAHRSALPPMRRRGRRRRPRRVRRPPRSCAAASSTCRSCGRSRARAALYIGGDSGPLHIAATTTAPDRGAVRADAARAIDAVARRRRPRGRDRRGPPAVPAVSPAALRARRFPLPDAARSGAGDRGGRTIVEGGDGTT